MKFLTTLGKPLQEAYRNRHEPEYSRILSGIYWRVLLFFTSLIVLLSLCYGLWQLVSLFGGLNTEEPELMIGKEARTPRLETLDATVKSFEERKARYESLKSGRLPLVSPR